MTENKNPFLKPYNTPHDTAPFHLIKIEHYEPALLEGMKEQNEEIDAIVNNPEAPTFQNTIVALEKSGALLDRVTTVFGQYGHHFFCQFLHLVTGLGTHQIAENSSYAV